MALSEDAVKALIGVGGAVLGAGAGALIKGYFDTRNQERRALSVVKSRPMPLVLVAQNVASRIELRVDGKKADVLASSEFHIGSTGNRAIMSPVVVLEIVGAANIIAIEKTFPTTNFENTANIDLEEKLITVTAPHLNPGQAIGFRVLTDSLQFSVTTKFSQPDVEFREGTYDDSYQGAFARIFFGKPTRTALEAFLSRAFP